MDVYVFMFLGVQGVVVRELNLCLHGGKSKDSA